MAIRELQEVLDFWFGRPATTEAEFTAKEKRWFKGAPELDAEIARRFGPLVELGLGGGLESWLGEPKGFLALILVLDQLPRNAFRGGPRAWAGDLRAQRLALDALDGGSHRDLSVSERQFAMIPLLHAEDLALQERFIIEYERLGTDVPAAQRPVYAMGIEQAHKYRGIIARFGRFPHRNKILGRASTDEELQFLREFGHQMAPSAAAKLFS